MQPHEGLRNVGFGHLGRCSIHHSSSSRHPNIPTSRFNGLAVHSVARRKLRKARSLRLDDIALTAVLALDTLHESSAPLRARGKRPRSADKPHTRNPCCGAAFLRDKCCNALMVTPSRYGAKCAPVFSSPAQADGLREAIDATGIPLPSPVAINHMRQLFVPNQGLR